MRLHRFFIEEKIADKKEITLADLELIKQLSKVFRFQPANKDKVGDKVILFDGSGFEYEAEIISLNKNNVTFRIIKSNRGSAFGMSKSLASVNYVSLYLSVIKKNNFELAVEKCTEIGVSKIQPIISERSEKKDLNFTRLNKIVKEASEQCGRMTLPEVSQIITLDQAVSRVVEEGGEGVVFHTVTDISTVHKYSHIFNRPGSQTHHLALTKAGIDGSHQMATFVGPEGGFTEKEMELFSKNNFKILSLGSNILRAETAAIIAVWSQLNS